MSGRLSFLPGEISFSTSKLFSNGKLGEEKSADVIVLTNVRKDRTIIILKIKEVGASPISQKTS